MQTHSAESVGQTGATDAEIWAAFAAQPLAGLDALYEQYSSLVYGLARRILANPQDAEDLTQEVFMSLLSHRTYDPARGSLGSYLVAVTRSRALDRLRARRRRLLPFDGGVALDDPDGRPALPIEEASMDQSARAVREALAGLPVAQRQVLELAYFRGLTQSEIAAHLAAPLGTVKSWARQGLYGLRNALGRFLD